MGAAISSSGREPARPEDRDRLHLAPSWLAPPHTGPSSGGKGGEKHLPYNFSKIAVLHIMWSMAQIPRPAATLGERDHPRAVETNMWVRQLAEASGDNLNAASLAHAKRAAQLPMQRFARPDEVASAALSPTHPQNRYITGVSLDVAGGAHLGMGS